MHVVAGIWLLTLLNLSSIQDFCRGYKSLLPYHFTESTSETHLSDDDHSSIYDKLKGKAANWRDIGRELGFKQGEMNNIQSNPILLTQSPPESYLNEMLSQWLQWAPGDGRGGTGFATRESLRAALLRANLGQLAQQFQ